MVKVVNQCKPQWKRARVSLAIGLASIHAASAEVNFNRDIRPILSDNCFFCHGPDPEERKADLRLDVEDAAKADLGGYHAVDPENPQESELLYRIMTDDSDDLMPPPDSGKALEATEITLLKEWLEAGAPYEIHWAYQIPEDQPIPSIQDSDWGRNWIDAFTLEKMNEAGLSPSPEADRAELLRRLSFDLNGLGPTPEEIDAFVHDNSPNAYEKQVDRLLRSQRFGERLAAYWLDLVRYADTVGYHGDQDHNISPYRDYVIESFNDNVPFDQFTREQLAGDLIPNAGQREKIASGYNRLLQTSHEGGVQPAEYRAIYAADRVRNVSAVWMGATVGCAQCHDHKYDPYSTKDFYSLSAFFADIDDERHFKVGTNALPTKRPPEIEVYPTGLDKELHRIDARIAEIGRLLEDNDSQELTEEFKDLSARSKEIRSMGRDTMITVALETPRVTRVLPRGNWLDESGEIVEPAVPEFLGSIETEGRASRLDLANWLTDPSTDNAKLTARVFANRLWYLMFGSGLSPSLDDFGGQGEPPTHPELLDQLAVEFVDSDWNIKRLIKEIAMSATYRQSSMAHSNYLAKDPENVWLSRQSRFRLPAEMIRDNALYVSGLLVEETGGESVKPYQPEGYYRHLNFPNREYEADHDEGQWRRGVYVHWQRQFLHPMLKAFDAPTREECTAQRPESNTPIAALTLLNDPTFVEAAREFAERLVEQGGDNLEDRIRLGFELVTSRQPDSYELQTLTDLYKVEKAEFSRRPEDGETLISTGLAPAPHPEDLADLAAMTSIARALLNLNETLTRN